MLDKAKSILESDIDVKIEVVHNKPFTVNPIPYREIDNGDTSIGKCERAILTALAQYPQGRTSVQVAILTGYSVNSGGFNNSLSKLRSGGLITREMPMVITDSGRQVLGEFQPLPTGQELINHWSRRLGKCGQSILITLSDEYPNGLSAQELADKTGYSANSGGFNNTLSKLRTLELITRGHPIKAACDMFQ